MKRTIPLKPITLLLAALALEILAAQVLAQSGAIYTITSSTVDSGGVTFLTSAAYKLGSTVGQHDAGDPTGDTYTIFSGFWFPAPPDPLEAAENPWAPNPLGDRLNRAGALKMPGSAVGQEVTIRITLTDLYIDSDADPDNGCPIRTRDLPDLTLFNGQVRYLGPPSAFDDNAAAAPKFIAAELQCTPFYRDWSPAALTADFGAGVNADTIYYYGKEVLPCSVYEAQQAVQTCVESANIDCFSTSLEIRTALWGDVWEPFGDINFTDIGKIVDAFKSIPFVPGDPPEGAPRKARAMLRENSAPFGSGINFIDIGKNVDAFKTIAYAEDGPTACP